jgi:hypothetical protein
MVGGPYDAIVEAASRKYGVPPAYIRSVMQVESSNRPDALGPVTRSGQRAGGLMQLMPATYAEVAEREGLGPDRMDPTNNIFAGTAYLRQNNDRFGGDWSKTFAAYNAGPSRVERGGPLPAETRRYVPKVMAGGAVDLAGASNRYGNQAVDEGANMPSFSFGAPQQQRVGSLTGLLEPDDDKNFYEGLGGIWNVGQTPSQPPAIDAAAMPGTTQTDRLGVGSRMNDLVSQLLQQSPQRQPALSQGQLQLAAAGNAVGRLAGMRDRKVGIGELLGALGGGMTQGAAAFDQQQRADRADQFAELGSLGKIQQYQRDEATKVRQVQAANAYADRLEQSGQKDLAAAIRGNPSLMDEVVKAQANSLFPKEGANFALSPGQTQFDRFGNKIASVADRPQTTTVSPGQSLIDTNSGRTITTGAPGAAQMTPAEVAAAGLPVGTVAQRKADGTIDVVNKPEDKGFDNATKLRTEFTTQAKPLVDMRQHFGRMQAAHGDQSGQADIALVYSYMKMLDPGSVVREGEFATAENAGGVADRFRQLYNRALNGERLPPAVRDDMLKQGGAQYATIEKQHSEIEQRYRDLAAQNGLDPSNVVIDLRGGVKLPDAGGKPGGLGNGGGMPDPNNPKPGDRRRNPSTGAQIEFNGSAWVPVQ